MKMNKERKTGLKKTELLEGKDSDNVSASAYILFNKHVSAKKKEEKKREKHQRTKNKVANF